MKIILSYLMLVAACASLPASPVPTFELAGDTPLVRWQLGGADGRIIEASQPSALNTVGKNGAKTAPMKPYGDEVNRIELPGRGDYSLECQVQVERAAEAALILATDGAPEIFVDGARVPAFGEGALKANGPRTEPYGIWRVPLKAGASQLVLRLEKATSVMARLTLPGDEPSGATPPRFWDERSGLNIRWRTPLTSWSQGGVLLAGGRLFTQAEPNRLLCLDPQSGKLLWEREIDPLDAPNFTEADRRNGRALWKEYHGRFLEFSEACAEYQWLKGEAAFGKHDKRRDYIANALRKATYFSSDAWTNPLPGSEPRLRELEALWRERKWGGEGSEPFRQAKGTHYNHDVTMYPFGKYETPEARAYYGKLAEIERDYGFHLMSSLGMQQRGHTGSKPCSDGQYVYVSMGWGQVACHDLDGNRRWLRWFRANKDFGSGGVDTVRDDQNQARVSPLLHGDWLVVVNGYAIRALDKNTGEPRWEVPLPARGAGRYEYGRPRVLELDGEEVLVCPQGPVLRLADGEVLLDQWADAWSPERSYAPVDYQRGNNRQFIMGTPAWNGRTAFMTHVMGIAAWTFGTTKEGRVAATSPWVWNLPFARYDFGPWSTHPLPSGQAESTSRTAPEFDPARNLLYFQCHGGELYVIDAATGETVREWTQPWTLTERGDEGQTPLLAGGLLYTHRNTLKTYVWQPGRNLYPVGTGLLESEWTRDVLERKLSWPEYKAKWFDRGYVWLWQTSRNWCEPLSAGNSLFLRTDEALYCIGRNAERAR